MKKYLSCIKGIALCAALVLQSNLSTVMAQPKLNANNIDKAIKALNSL